ncbi:MAG TPA: proline--tRNA ligase [Acidimicrobiales bacterium]|nr:proline--tRNA ligase [Acidimicrobiales bacterium]
MASHSALTPQGVDFPRWYQDVVAKAEMADNGPVRGTMVIRPYGYAIWEHMQAEMDARIKATGAENAYFPLFIPQSYFAREAEHVEGFSPELAVVTHAGGEDLAEPIVVRPTSETVIGEFMAKWVQSYRDLPLLLNQWANVVRWELRPRLFLRSSEFLWQEGHTAHASHEDAAAFAMRIHLEVYNDFLVNVLAVPSYLGIKTAAERFAGAINTLTCEGMMRDGKALQMTTSHLLGQNFARAFGIYFQSEEGQSTLCHTTSWGASTRLVGGLIMAHGDDDGLVVPPRLAPIQTVVIAVREEPAVLEACDAIVATLRGAGVRVSMDRGRGSFGRRITDWEIKGVPLRVEVGPRDLAEGVVTLARRDNAEKQTVRIDALASLVPEVLERAQGELFARALTRRNDATFDVTSVQEAIDAGQQGFARLAWSVVGEEGERLLNQQALSVRCLQRADGSMPESPEERDLVCIVAKSY